MDRERILSKIDSINNYLDELDKIKPKDFNEYENSIEKKRACERLLQISIESVIDICNLFVSSLGLGLPSDEDDLLKKLEKEKIFSKELLDILSNMKGFRNILVHKYGEVDDELVYENLSEKLDDFELFIKEVLDYLKTINSSR